MQLETRHFVIVAAVVAAPTAFALGCGGGAKAVGASSSADTTGAGGTSGTGATGAPSSGATGGGTAAGTGTASTGSGVPGDAGVAPLPYGNDDGGLVGKANYLIYSDCRPLQNPTVHISFSELMSAGSGGFDFQLNANSLATAANPNGATLSGQPSHMGWQQYIINVRPGAIANTTEVWGFIEPWPSGDPGVANGANLVNTTSTPFYLATLTQTPTPTLPAGTHLSIELVTDPTSLAVTDLTFTLKLPAGTPTDATAHPTYYNGTPIALVGLPRAPGLCGNPAKGIAPDPRFCLDGGPGTVGTPDLTPVTSFRMNFAGLVVASGAGEITYTASSATPLFPVPPNAQNPTSFPYLPACSTGADTAETSNVVYSTMAVNGNTQSFGITLDCESGTDLYFFDCDYKPFCATPANAAQCLGNGWCFQSPWTGVTATGVGTCTGLTPFENRDPLGGWLSTVTYP